MPVPTELPRGSADADSTGDASGAGMPAGLRSGPVYLDYNATTPIDSRVLAAMMPVLDAHFGNPSSSQGRSVPAPHVWTNEGSPRT